MEEYSGISPLLRLAASISIGIGIFNLLPIAPLDGGGIVLALVEGVRRGKKVSPALQRLVYSLGWALILTLFIFISYNDIARLISGGDILP
jgi:regulator of sigma E protease